MSIHEQLLGKWQQCREKRYPVLLIITGPLDTLFPTELVEKFAEISKAQLFNFNNRYQNRLDEFLTWQTVRDEIYAEANDQAVIVTELEPFYAKWPIDERFAFFKNIIRSEPSHGIVIIINCQEDLSDLKQIEENSRGLIWSPSR
ncbi:MAG: hypothetical protein PF503_03355 [Desulfobacula sp.]|jgi:hypothetical protein|nr:hypothetical protein [Desulfobacula sp.]